MEKSTHKAEVVKIKLQPCPNADSLSIVNVFDGYPCVVRTSDWKDEDLAVYITPDSLVNTNHPLFAFLKKSEGRVWERITVRKFKGNISFGLLVPAPEGVKEGDNIADDLNILHYEPSIKEEKTSFGKAYSIEGPAIYAPCYDVDSLRRYVHVFEPNEPIFVSEKIHGASARYVYTDKMYVGSHKTWKNPEYNNVWTDVLKKYPELEEFCCQNPGVVVYGEVYGKIQNLNYGLPIQVVDFACFDILKNGYWMDAYEAREFAKNLPWVPHISHIINFDFNILIEEAEKYSVVKTAPKGHIREGLVIKPLNERIHRSIGRVNLKLVSTRYLSLK